ncbi:hypothetical protein CEXT_712721 [Caerostris extrusa]|uniref:Uncharacterized protein n=1 Tax=Caerostris extrusa TaxID=172846 RepID=A0AAV4VJ51_CAEEX|nr:hypothetical protein CEXT_712721 [Caerostris extrusa]
MPNSSRKFEKHCNFQSLRPGNSRNLVQNPILNGKSRKSSTFHKIPPERFLRRGLSSGPNACEEGGNAFETHTPYPAVPSFIIRCQHRMKRMTDEKKSNSRALFSRTAILSFFCRINEQEDAGRMCGDSNFVTEIYIYVYARAHLKGHAGRIDCRIPRWDNRCAAEGEIRKTG